MNAPLSFRVVIAGALVAIVFEILTALMVWDNEQLWMSVVVVVGLALALIFAQLSLRAAQRHLICANETIIELKKRLQLAYGPPPKSKNERGGVHL